MTTRPTTDDAGLSKDQLDLIQQFEADYNAVDHFFRKALMANSHVSFSQLVNDYAQKHLGWRDADLLKTIANIRNAIVHSKTQSYHYLAVPTPTITKNLSECRERLINPARVIPTFQRNVEKIAVDDTLVQVLKIIRLRDYSQFPVYEADRFRGLLTENGITRWLADHVTTELSLVELEDIPIRKVLRSEEKRENYRFVARDARVGDVSGLFASQELLEAVLITASGKASEALLGIATRWDLIHLR